MREKDGIPEVVSVRIAQIDTHRIAAVLNLNALEPGRYLRNSVLPRDGLPAASDPLDGRLQPVFVNVVILQSNRLGADMTFTEWVLGIAFDRQHLSIGVFDNETAHRLTDVAGTIVGLDVGGPGHGPGIA